MLYDRISGNWKSFEWIRNQDYCFLNTNQEIEGKFMMMQDESTMQATTWYLDNPCKLNLGGYCDAYVFEAVLSMLGGSANADSAVQVQTFSLFGFIFKNWLCDRNR